MAKARKLLCAMLIIAMVVVVIAEVPVVPIPEVPVVPVVQAPAPEPEPNLCDETCIDDEDCQAIHDDSYCYDQGACGTDENGEKLGYCYGIDACSEYPHCTVLTDCPADGNTYVDCCEFGICPDGLGYCC